MTGFTTLINASELDTIVKNSSADVKILDCRARLGDRDFGPGVYRDGHIPAAQYLSLDDDLASPPGRGGRHPLPVKSALAARLARLGLNDSDQIVVYDDAGGAFAARAWWCLRWLGHQRAALLDGGISAWSGALTAQQSVVEQGDFSVRASLTRTIDAAALARDIALKTTTITLLDARTQARFDAVEEPIDPVAGHIPGAHCLPLQDNLDAHGKFCSAAALRARFAKYLHASVVCYCGSGVTATHNILAMKIAGYPEPALYPGSWSEWLLDPARPRAP